MTGDFIRHIAAASVFMPGCLCFIIPSGTLCLPPGRVQHTTSVRDAAEEHTDSKDTTRLGQYLEQLKHPSHNLSVAIWQDQYCVQWREGRQRPMGRLHLLVHCLVETSATAEQHAGIRANPCLHIVARLSHAVTRTRPILPVAVVAVVAAAKGSTRHESRNYQLSDFAYVAFCVADELLSHH